MTKADLEDLRRIVKSNAFISATREELANLPMMTPEEILVSKPSAEDMALRHAFCSGAIHIVNNILRKGKAPKAAISQVQAKYLKSE